MSKRKQSICYMCKKKLDYKPTRIVKQEYGVKGYNQYAPVDKYDLCDRCFGILDKWLKKHR